jgi:integrase
VPPLALGDWPRTRSPTKVCDLNPFKGIRVRAGDPRAQKKRRPIRVFSFQEMHRFAKAAGRHEALVRTFTDTGMRLGEVLPLRAEDFDGETLQVAAPPMRGRSSMAPRPTMERGAPAASSQSSRPSRGGAKPSST